METGNAAHPTSPLNNPGYNALSNRGHAHVARNYVREGENLPVEDKDARLRAYVLAEQWADKGLEIDPRCGECSFYKFAAVGRQATTKGVFTSIRRVSEMADLLELSIELEPAHADNEWNTEMANVYSAASGFYRILPDWFWLKWVVGVRGDNARAVEYSREAVRITPSRIDYQLELGAALLCLAKDSEDPHHIAEGRQALERTRTLEARLATDRIDRQHAQRLLAEPHRACGYARDGWINITRRTTAEAGSSGTDEQGG